MARTYNVQNLKRWPKGTLPPGLFPGMPRSPEHVCAHPGCRHWRMRGIGLCYLHSGRALSTVRQAVARRRNRAPKTAELLAGRDAQKALSRAYREGLPEGLQGALAWRRALADVENGPRAACLAALAASWGNPDAWDRALALLQAAERGEVTGKGGDMRGVIGGSGNA